MGKNRVKKAPTKIKTLQAPNEEPEELTKAPHSFVIHRGSVGKHIMALMRDFRKVMEPYTASALKVNKKNTIKDFISISGLLHVTHMAVFTITEVSPYLRLARLPQGPTLTFKIHDYALSKDVVSSLRKQYVHTKSFSNSPLIILNGFSGEGAQLKLMSTMFQSMFPTLNVAKLDLNNIKRCVLLNYNEETKCIDFRHYVIRVTPTGLNRGVKKLVLGKIPNLSKYNDVSDFVVKDDLLSDMSDAEDEGGQVVLPQKLASKGNFANNTSAVRLTELGPRLSLQLVKVEGGLMDGEVMFHEFVHKSEEEIASMKKERRIKRKLKEMRRKEQEMNVKRKEEEKALHKEKSLEGMKRKAQEDRGAEEEEDDDAEWYRKEVGQEPEPELFSADQRGVKRKGGPFGQRSPFKKGRFSFNGKDGHQGGPRRNQGDRGPSGSRGRGTHDKFQRNRTGPGGRRGTKGVFGNSRPGESFRRGDRGRQGGGGNRGENFRNKRGRKPGRN